MGCRRPRTTLRRKFSGRAEVETKLVEKAVVSGRTEVKTELVEGAIPKTTAFSTSSVSTSALPENVLLEVVLDLLHPILDLQVNLRLLEMVPNDSPYPKTLSLTPKSSL